MPRKPIEISPAAAREFVKDLRAFFAISSPIKRDEIAARQLRTLQEHQRPGEKKLRLVDIRDLFLAMKDHA
jgi:hypothetical protein